MEDLADQGTRFNRVDISFKLGRVSEQDIQEAIESNEAKGQVALVVVNLPELPILMIHEGGKPVPNRWTTFAVSGAPFEEIAAHFRSLKDGEYRVIELGRPRSPKPSIPEASEFQPLNMIERGIGESRNV